MKGVTMSALPRLAVCAGGAALPLATRENKYAEGGIDRHEVVERAVTSGDISALPVEIRDLIPNGVIAASEVAVAYDYETDTARELGVGIGRAYEIGETEIPGTIDLLVLMHMVAGGRLTVVDWKFMVDVGAPDENDQIMGYALCAARIHKVEEVEVIVGYLDDDGEGAVRLARPLVRRIVDSIDLDGHARKIRRMVAEIKAQRCRPTPDVHESRHCKLCPAARHCPAKNALIQAALDPSRSPTANIDLREEMDVARVGLLFERLTIMHDAIGGLLADIRSRAWYDDIPLPNGKVLHRQYDKGKRQVTDADKLYELLVERHGQRVADAAIKRESSIERTREALKGAAGVKSVAKELAAVLEIAKERGAVTQKPSERVVETTPEKIENQQARLLAANE